MNSKIGAQLLGFGLMGLLGEELANEKIMEQGSIDYNPLRRTTRPQTNKSKKTIKNRKKAKAARKARRINRKVKVKKKK